MRLKFNSNFIAHNESQEFFVILKKTKQLVNKQEKINK